MCLCDYVLQKGFHLINAVLYFTSILVLNLNSHNNLNFIFLMPKYSCLVFPSVAL